VVPSELWVFSLKTGSTVIPGHDPDPWDTTELSVLLGLGKGNGKANPFHFRGFNYPWEPGGGSMTVDRVQIASFYSFTQQAPFQEPSLFDPMFTMSWFLDFCMC
jgi:hypothetical protein